MAARIDIFVFARWTARISGTFRYETESCSATRAGLPACSRP
jgi:hypothetical protein